MNRGVVAAPVVDQVADLLRKKLNSDEFESRLLHLLPEDGDERIACLAEVVDTIIAVGTYAGTDWLVDYLYSRAFSEYDYFGGFTPAGSDTQTSRSSRTSSG